MTDHIAGLIRDGTIRRVVFLTGAGVSVAAGIPDFRSAGGMYDTLRPELLTASAAERAAMCRDPTMVVSWELFKDNQFPYLEVRRPFILGVGAGTWKATAAHYFAKVCEDKGLLVKLLTQNIDGLDYQTGIPDAQIVPVHGSLGRAACEFCSAEVDFATFQEAVRTQIKDIYSEDEDAPAESTPILCESCGRAGVKPSTVLYGRSLPDAFSEVCDSELPSAELLIVAGTSLTVSPANSVVRRVGKRCFRVLMNREKVGEDLGLKFKSTKRGRRDVFVEGECDEGILDLVEQLGWLDDLAQYRDALAPASQQALDARLRAAAVGSEGEGEGEGGGKEGGGEWTLEGTSEGKASEGKAGSTEETEETANISDPNPTLAPTLASAAAEAAKLLARVKEANGGLLVLTGAGMSVKSGVPVFRGADGSMSEDFLRFLGAYNAARRKAGLEEADDWFSFSVPEMFRPETRAEAWAYWSWRTTRALVEPAADYTALGKLVEYFGPADRTFVQTSNCDMLHELAGIHADQVQEIHGSLGRLQCAGRAGGSTGGGRGMSDSPCCDELIPVDAAFLDRLKAAEAAGEAYVPMCPKECGGCLRPNVMIFGDWNLVDAHLLTQKDHFERFIARHTSTGKAGKAGKAGKEDKEGKVSAQSSAFALHMDHALAMRANKSKDQVQVQVHSRNWVVLEIGGGVVVPSIRSNGETYGGLGAGLIRINPSLPECTTLQTGAGKGTSRCLVSYYTLYLT